MEVHIILLHIEHLKVVLAVVQVLITHQEQLVQMVKDFGVVGVVQIVTHIEMVAVAVVQAVTECQAVEQFSQ